MLLPYRSLQSHPVLLDTCQAGTNRWSLKIFVLPLLPLHALFLFVLFGFFCFVLFWFLFCFVFFFAMPMAFRSTQAGDKKDQTCTTAPTWATQWQHWSLNPLSHQGTPLRAFFFFLVTSVACRSSQAWNHRIDPSHGSNTTKNLTSEPHGNTSLFCLTATLVAYGSSWAGSWIRAASAGLHHSHSNTGSGPHLWPT